MLRINFFDRTQPYISDSGGSRTTIPTTARAWKLRRHHKASRHRTSSCITNRIREPLSETNLCCRGLAGGLDPRDTPQELSPFPLQRRPGIFQRTSFSRSVLLDAGSGFRLHSPRVCPAGLHIDLGRRPKIVDQQRTWFARARGVAVAALRAATAYRAIVCVTCVHPRKAEK